jgi:hypothetical protein
MAFPQSVPTNYIQLSAGKFDKANGSDATVLAETFSDIATAKPKRLVIHFHGGLVSRDSALASAERLSLLYKNAGAESFFVIWETSVREIIGQNVQRIVNEPIFQSILVRSTEFVKGKLDKAVGPGGGRGAAGLPQMFASEVQDELNRGKIGGSMFDDLDLQGLSPDQAQTLEQALTPEEQQYIEDQVNRDADLKRHVQAIIASKTEVGSRGARGTAVEATLMDADVIDEVAPAEFAAPDEASRSILGTIMLGKRVVTVVGAVIWRYANGRDHGVYLTIVEEIMRAFYVRAAGRFLWSQMKHAIATSFMEGPDYGGVAFVEQLARLWKDHKPCITLVGHSAGAIYVGRLLKELNEAMDQDFRADVVLIAPACTFDYLADSLHNAGQRVANLRIFGMSNPVELNDHLVPGIYPASLLYFVSGVLEDDRDEPLVGMQRYYSNRYSGGRFTAITEVKGFHCLVKDRAFAWAQTAGFDGANCDMVRHGGWADAPATLQSVLFLIQEGCSNAW